MSGMKIEQIISLALTPIVALTLVATSVATREVPRFPSSATPKQGKVKYVKKYVMITGSNIPFRFRWRKVRYQKQRIPSEVIRRMR